MTAEVEAGAVAPAQPEGDVSSAGMPEPQEAWAESPVPREALWMSVRQPTMGR
jgi:hypothetical protein